jgi:hypothetical protein
MKILDEAQTERSHLSQPVNFSHDAIFDPGGEYNASILHLNAGNLFITH